MLQNMTFKAHKNDTIDAKIKQVIMIFKKQMSKSQNLVQLWDLALILWSDHNFYRFQHMTANGLTLPHPPNADIERVNIHEQTLTISTKSGNVCQSLNCFDISHTATIT